MGILSKLAFWKNDDLDLGSLDSGSQGGDPFATDNHPDPMANTSPLGSDPLSQPQLSQHESPLGDMDQNPFSGGNDPLSSGPKVNSFGAGLGAAPNRAPPGYDSVSQSRTQDPFSAKAETSSAPMDRDFEVISAKMDSIKASVELLVHKVDKLTDSVAAIEAIAKQEQNQQW